MRAFANDNSGASDFVRPGHVFPLIAKDGGVLMRSGRAGTFMRIPAGGFAGRVGVFAS